MRVSFWAVNYIHQHGSKEKLNIKSYISAISLKSGSKTQVSGLTKKSKGGVVKLFLGFLLPIKSKTNQFQILS